MKQADGGVTEVMISPDPDTWLQAVEVIREKIKGSTMEEGDKLWGDVMLRNYTEWVFIKYRWQPRANSFWGRLFLKFMLR